MRRNVGYSIGLDPTIGYLHAYRPGRTALLYDLMEPLRPQVDQLALGFVHSHTIAQNDFVLDSNGVCRLHPQLARQVIRLAVSDAAVSEVRVRTTEELKASCIA